MSDKHVDFAAISERFAGIGKTIEQDWKWAKYTKDKHVVAVIVDVMENKT